MIGHFSTTKKVLYKYTSGKYEMDYDGRFLTVKIPHKDGTHSRLLTAKMNLIDMNDLSNALIEFGSSIKEDSNNERS